MIATSSMVPQRTNKHACFIFPLSWGYQVQSCIWHNTWVNFNEMICVNNQYFKFHEMQINWSIYRTKMVLISWFIEQIWHFIVSKLYFREPRRSMTHVGNIFTYKSNVQHLTLTKINNKLWIEIYSLIIIRRNHLMKFTS